MFLSLNRKSRRAQMEGSKKDGWQSTNEGVIKMGAIDIHEPVIHVFYNASSSEVKSINPAHGFQGKSSFGSLEKRKNMAFREI